MMFDRKYAIAFLLLFATCSPYLVSGRFRPEEYCGKEKKKIFDECKDVLKKEGFLPIGDTKKDGPCCEAIRQARRKMNCIKLLITSQDEAVYNIKKIQDLQPICEPSHPPQVAV
ncbi:unnamed protein product [Urochloa decumbens]|uniref:Bifunctional inhibitor/plant lipid transfer protein/seed storage helical domain-containing protein n=1 Tax=Urochloa decumbens TaxID=240449 RepID=A0ABC9BA95_9POAL